jgi:cholesterol transport system auxiliary component
MSYFKKASLLLLSISLLFGACINLKQPGNKIEYYTLEYDPPGFSGMAPLPYSIRVERFTTAPTYNTTQIIYREQSFKRAAYAYHKWRVNPGDLVTHFLDRDIRHSGLFGGVIPRDSKFKASFILEGKVDEFFEQDGPEQWNGVLSLSISLIAENEPDINKGAIFQKSYSRKEACKKKNPRALAEALSLAMAGISVEIIKDIHSGMQKMERSSD